MITLENCTTMTSLDRALELINTHVTYLVSGVWTKELAIKYPFSHAFYLREAMMHEYLDREAVFQADYAVLSANLCFWAERINYAPDDFYAIGKFIETKYALMSRAECISLYMQFHEVSLK